MMVSAMDSVWLGKQDGVGGRFKTWAWASLKRGPRNVSSFWSIFIFGSYLKEGFMHDMKEVESYTADERIASD